jgi:hypothetical protein
VASKAEYQSVVARRSLDRRQSAGDDTLMREAPPAPPDLKL